MVCAITDKQKGWVQDVLGKIMLQKMELGPEYALTTLHKIILDKFLNNKEGKQKADLYAYTLTKYGAEVLPLLRKAVLKESNKNLIEKIGLDPESIPDISYNDIILNELTKDDVLRKLLGVKSPVSYIFPTVTQKDVQPHIDAIETSFPELEKQIWESHKKFDTSVWEYPILKTPEEDIRLIRSTVIVNRKDRDSSANNQYTRAGNLVDAMVRKFFRNPMNYDKFIDSMKADKDVIKAYKELSENTSTPSEEITPIQEEYFSRLMDDIIHVIHLIQYTYPDSHITDLTKNEKGVRLYSKVGVIGELDLLAIKPDGTYTVIDMKLTSHYTNVKGEKFNKQLSYYDNALSNVKGLKSSGKVDVIHMKMSISNISNFQLGKELNISNLVKLSIPSIEKISFDVLPESELRDAAKEHLKALDAIYSRQRIIGKPSDFFGKPLQMKFLLSEGLTNQEDLESYQDWLIERFPELKGRVDIIRTFNSDAGGEFFVDMIRLYERSNKGVHYHEGWHRFSQLYLTKKEKQDLYKSVQKDGISFTTRDGRKLNTATAYPIDIEEFLAEEFRKYAMSPSKYAYPTGNKKPKNFFQKMWELLKKFFGFHQKNGSQAYIKLFSELDSNTFNRSNFSTDNVIFHHMKSLFNDELTGNNGLIDNKTFLKLRNLTDSIVSNYMVKNSLIPADLATEYGLGQLTSVIINSLNEEKSKAINTRNELKDKLAKLPSDNSVDVKTIQSTIVHYDYLVDILSYLTEESDKGPIRISSFLSSYFKFSSYTSFRDIFRKYTKEVNDIISEESLASAIGENKDDTDENSDIEIDDSNIEDFDFNNPGNKYHPSSLMKSQAKDLFNGIYRMKGADAETLVNYIFSNNGIPDDMKSEYELDEWGQPIQISQSEAFNKTLELLQGSFTLDEMQRRLDNPENVAKFPESIQISNRIFGSTSNPDVGLLPRLSKLEKLIDEGKAFPAQKMEHLRLYSLLLHFQSVMSMVKVPSDNFSIRADLQPATESDNAHIIPIMMTRDNVESVIHAIIGDFMVGFQTNMEQQANMASSEFDMDELVYKSVRKVKNIYHTFHDFIMQDEKAVIAGLENPEPLYDHRGKKFYFNPYFIRMKFADKRVPNREDLKYFFELLGININEQAYKNRNHYEEMIRVYTRLQAPLATYNDLFFSKLNNLRNEKSANTKRTLRKWKDSLSKLEGASPMEKVRLAEEILSLEKDIQKYIKRLFTSNPVLAMMQDSRDRGVTSKKEFRPLASFWSQFQRLAKIEKNYQKRFSSGNTIVGDTRKWVHYLTNNQLLVSTLINRINSVEDFDSFPELQHVNPNVNPRMKNSVMYRSLFDENGKRRVDRKLNISTLDISTLIDRDASGKQVISSKKMSEMNADEKLMIDILLLGREGWSESRRMEASNTSWRQGIVTMKGEDRVFIKAIENLSSFEDARFLSIIRGYIQYAAAGYKYYSNPENEKRSQLFDRKGELGIFDEMLPDVVDEIKQALEDGVDPNSLMQTIEDSNPELFQKINQGITKYFSEMAVSFKERASNILSEKSKSLLKKVSQIQAKDKDFHMMVDNFGNLSDAKTVDILAHDFIQVMEDAIWFFGDYTYYADPIKRRKVEANNGSINIIGRLLENSANIIQKHNSLTGIYHKLKGTTLDKNVNVIRKSIIADIVKKSKLLENDDVWKVIQEIHKNMTGDVLSVDQIKEANKSTIEALTKMKIADGAGWLNPDHVRTMRLREMNWDDNTEMEFQKQMLILASSLGYALSKEEEALVNSTKSSINVSKLATTGPILHKNMSPFEQVFDKMGLRALMPEYDLNTVMRDVLLDMLKQGIDYVVTKSGSKIFVEEEVPLFSENGDAKIPKGGIPYVEHNGAFHKFQQNTTPRKEDSKLAVQVRAMMSELNLIMEKNSKYKNNLPQSFQKSFRKFIKSIGDYIIVNSGGALSRMGLDENGNISDKGVFVNYLRERLLENGIENEDLLSQLDIDENGNFSNFLESLPFQKDIADLYAGIINDNFKNLDLGGSKLVQSSELGTKLRRPENSEAATYGTAELRTIRAKRNVKGDIIGIEPWDCKIPFRKEFYGLLTLNHPDGKSIRQSSNRKESLKRLNEALNDDAWVEKNSELITLLGVRVPFQHLNFGGHIRIREFLPESLGDMIILPPEFYAFSGSDNDIDSVTATFPQLTKSGKYIDRPTDSYSDITNRIEVLQAEQGSKPKEVVATIDSELSNLLNEFREQQIYSSMGWTLDDLANDFQLVIVDNMIDIAGRQNNKSKLMKLIKKSMYPELIDKLGELLEQKNSGRKLTSSSAIELKELRIKQRNYLRGIQNDILSSALFFWQQPEMMANLVSTDSISYIKEVAEEMYELINGEKIDLAAKNTSLGNMNIITNIKNHDNHFMKRRAFLGKTVKMRSMIVILSTLKYKLPKKVIVGAYVNLLVRGGIIPKKEGKTYPTYELSIRTPLLYNKDTTDGISLSIFDEDNASVTKIMSALASSAIDLFNNPNVLPSLNIHEMNVDSLLFLLSQGVPFRRATLFFNTPIIQAVQSKMMELGTDALPKHAIVSVGAEIQDIQDSLQPIFNISDTSYGQTPAGFFRVKNTYDSGEFINFMMPRSGKAAEEYLTNKHIEFKEEDMIDFIKDFAKYKETRPNASLRAFLSDNIKYLPISKNILAYYSTLNELSQLFYSLMAARLDRASSKMNGISEISNMKSGEYLRIISGLSDQNFEEKLRGEDSVISPFYKDNILLNIITSRFPEIFKHKYVRDKLIISITRTLLNVTGTREDKKKIEDRMLSDFIHSIISNFYITKIDNKTEYNENSNREILANTLYELVRYDITPLTRFLANNKEDALKEITDTFSGRRYQNLPEEARVQAMFADGLFSEQLDKFFAKYPELKSKLTLFSSMESDITQSVDPQKDGKPNEIDILNEYPQLYIHINISPDPHEKMIQEQTMRDEFTKLLMFDISLFTGAAEMAKEQNRTEFYNDKDVKAEIRQFSRVIALRLLAQAPHLQRGRAAYSYLIPYHLLKDIVEESINNFNRFIEEGATLSGIKTTDKEREDMIDVYMKDFTTMYRLMNDDHDWMDRDFEPVKAPEEIPMLNTDNESDENGDFEIEEDISEWDEDPSFASFDDPSMNRKAKKIQQRQGIPFQKSYTGKIYNTVANSNIQLFRMKLAFEKGWKIGGRNEFKISDEDPLNC